MRFSHLHKNFSARLPCRSSKNAGRANNRQKMDGVWGRKFFACLFPAKGGIGSEKVLVLLNFGCYLSNTFSEPFKNHRDFPENKFGFCLIVPA